MSESAATLEKSKEFAAKSKKLGDLLAMVQSTDDYSKKEFLEAVGATDAKDAMQKVKALSTEVDDVGRDLEALQLDDMKRENQGRLDGLKRIKDRPGMPGTKSLFDQGDSLGRMVVEHKDWAGSRTPQGSVLKFDASDLILKTLLQTSAGWQPRTANGDILVDKIIRPVQVLDVFPTDRTDLFEIPSMEETTRTQAAAELAEAGTYAEDAFVYTRRSSPIRKIGSEIPVTDEQLDDVPTMQALLNNRLTFGVRARLDQQIMVGDGTGSTLTGLINATNVQTQAKGSDPGANAIFKAITLVRVSGRAQPTTVFMHGTDYQNLRLAQNANGDYQFGPPYAVGEVSAWGLPIVQTEALTQGTALVAAMSPLWVTLWYRKDIEVQVGFINDQFIKGQKTLRADARCGLWIGRGQAFAKVTGL